MLLHPVHTGRANDFQKHILAHWGNLRLRHFIIPYHGVSTSDILESSDIPSEVMLSDIFTDIQYTGSLASSCNFLIPVATA